MAAEISDFLDAVQAACADDDDDDFSDALEAPCGGSHHADDGGEGQDVAGNGELGGEHDDLQSLFDMATAPSEPLFARRSRALMHHMRAMKAARALLRQKAVVAQDARDEVQRVNADIVIRKKRTIDLDGRSANRIDGTYHSHLLKWGLVTGFLFLLELDNGGHGGQAGARRC